MSISEIKNNAEDLESLDTKTLARYINELLLYIKRQDSKNVSLRADVKYMHKQLERLKVHITKILDSNTEVDKLWDGKTK